MDNASIDRMQKDQRIHTGIGRGERVTITIDGRTVSAYAGESIAAVLTAAGIRRIRHAPHHKDSRGLYCNMGVCHGCLVTVDGQPNVRACVTPVASGQQIVLQDGLGRFDTDAPQPSPGRLVRQKTSLVIIGAGPAGLCAAVAAANQGARVLVIDENPQPGGQIYRQLPETFQIEAPGKLGRDYADGRALLNQAAQFSDAITIWNDALVWGVFDSRQLAVARGDDLVLIDARAIVVAPGAYERPVPVPGWTLPGVMTAGGAQGLLKSQRVRPGQRVLLAGSGPLQLVVADQMLAAGMDVVAVVESASSRSTWRYLPELLSRPGLVKQGLGYLYRLKRAGVPMLRSHVLEAIEGDRQAQKAILGKVDPRGVPIPGDKKIFDADTVCIGYGLIPSTWLTHMLGCRHIYHTLVGGWVPDCDENMQTDRSGVFVAGDGAGIAGVLVARLEGKLAGLYASACAGVISTRRAREAARPIHRELASLQKFRYAMDRMYPFSPDLYANMTDETILCRCEGVTAGDIRRAVREGTTDLNNIKKRTRMGMGYCQGANCMPAVAAMLAREFGVNPSQIQTMTTRPPARPIPLHLLMVDMEDGR